MLVMGFISADPALREAVAEQLANAQVWQAAFFSNTKDALEAWKEGFPSLVFWDTGANEQAQALRFYKSLRGQKEPPWLLVSGPLLFDGEGENQAETIEKPLRLGALLARLRFYERLCKQPADKAFRLGPWSFFPRRRLLCASPDGENVTLTDKEAALLEHLALAEGLVSRKELLEEVWGYGQNMDTHTLETHIYKLRRKLMAESKKLPDCFKTERGGYGIDPTWRES